MANSYTQLGQKYMLAGAGGIIRVGTKIKLLSSTSVPTKAGTGFVEVSGTGGYTTGGQVVAPWSTTINGTNPASLPSTSGDWTLSLDGANIKATLTNKSWTATSGGILNVGGAYLTNAADEILCWWERSPSSTIANGDTLELDSLYLEIV